MSSSTRSQGPRIIHYSSADPNLDSSTRDMMLRLNTREEEGLKKSAEEATEQQIIDQLNAFLSCPRHFWAHRVAQGKTSVEGSQEGGPVGTLKK